MLHNTGKRMHNTHVEVKEKINSLFKHRFILIQYVLFGMKSILSVGLAVFMYVTGVKKMIK